MQHRLHYHVAAHESILPTWGMLVKTIEMHPWQRPELPSDLCPAALAAACCESPEVPLQASVTNRRCSRSQAARHSTTQRVRCCKGWARCQPRCVLRPSACRGCACEVTLGAGSGGAIWGTIMRPVIVLPLHAAAPCEVLHGVLIHLQRPLKIVEIM